MNSVMKAWPVIGLIFAAAIFATIPISTQVTPRGVELSVDQAQAVTYGRYRRVNRRLLRRGEALTPRAPVLGRPWGASYAAGSAAAAAGYYDASYYRAGYRTGYPYPSGFVYWGVPYEGYGGYYDVVPRVGRFYYGSFYP
jgi:hypothetical protein